MNRRSFALSGPVSTLIIAIVLVSQGYALTTGTHAHINEYVAGTAMDGFSLDLYLKNQLGFQGGIETVVPGHVDGKPRPYKVWEWFAEGGVSEDSPWYDPNTRSRNHYHNPLNNQGFSGIGGTGFLSGESSIVWSQRPLGTQSHGGNYSWNDVRKYFYEALTGSDQTTKERNFAETFRGLGQLMHLIHDLSVPEHTRDDGHYLKGYENWVAGRDDEGNPNVVIHSVTPVFFGSSALGDPNPLAAVPIANLFDTDQYVLTNPDPSRTLQPGIGLSEYTNANFLSPDTMFTSDFPYPRKDQCTVTVEDRNSRQYLSNRGNTTGKPIDHLATVSRLYSYRMRYFPQNNLYLPLALDSLCYEEYASHLIPRAVGYSSGLLKYFFRGKIEIANAQLGYNPTTREIDSITLLAKNVTENGEEMLQGTVDVVLKHKNWYEQEYHYTVKRIEAGSSIPRDQSAEFVLYLSDPIPIDTTDAQVFLVFKGKLGLESGGIGVGFKEVISTLVNEEWDNGLAGNHSWQHMSGGHEYGAGAATNSVSNDILFKSNLRYVGQDGACYNESYLSLVDGANPQGILVKPDTFIHFSIPRMDINEIPPAPPEETTNWQALNLMFNNGYRVQFSRPGQLMDYGPKTAHYYFAPSFMIVENIYDLFQGAGISISEPLYLEAIDFIQQLFDLEEPSAIAHRQQMEVDFIRIIGSK